MLYWSKDIEHNIYITNEAKTMLNKHIDFLNRVSINSTIKLKKNIKEYLIILKHFPRIGQKIYLGNIELLGLRKIVVNKRYILVYNIVQNKIYITAIFDSRQNNNYYLINKI